MKRLYLCAFSLLLAAASSFAQFSPGQVLGAAALNAALAAPTITGGTINGASVGQSVPAAVNATTFNGNTWTPGTGTLSIGAGRIAAFVNTITFQGTDGTVMTFPSTSATMARTDAGNTFTGHQTFEGVTATGATGSGKMVFGTSATLISPSLGTPLALVGTNITGTAAGLTAGSVTANANLTGPITSVGNATSVGAQTGSGSTFVMQTSPNLITPLLGAATASSVTLSGDLAFSSTGQRISGDFTNATRLSRTLFQTNNPGNSTFVGAIPNGSGTAAHYAVYTSSMADNSSIAQFYADGSAGYVGINSAASGTGTVLPVAMTISGTPKLVVSSGGRVLVGGTTDDGVHPLQVSGAAIMSAVTATSFNGNTWTAGTGTLTLASGKTLTVNSALTMTGTDATTMTFPTTSATVARTDAAQTFTGVQTLASAPIMSAVTGLVKANGTSAVTAAAAGTDYGYANVPQNSQSANYTTVLADAGKHILHPSADTSTRTWTIDSNANVTYPIGTAITFINQNGAGTITIAITSDTMRLAGAGTAGNRTLAANGVATAVKIGTTEWIISGVGLT